MCFVGNICDEDREEIEDGLGVHEEILDHRRLTGYCFYDHWFLKHWLLHISRRHPECVLCREATVG
jgi:hypothetical protein